MELPFDRAALRGDPMPEGMALYEQAAFQALRGLYALYRRGGISREDAAREKEKILEAYRQEGADWARSREITQAHARLWQNIEAAANRYGRERTLDHADAFVRAVYGAGVKAGKGEMP